ncbi:MAG TPA: PucR family transcriptional regulator ligand-binding domain-containing protein [Pseudonocardiaceae bacterium]|jgi:purine catabolism regulator|nr:PucR family transcriptional regulator ligand-binding domain-containing protein [Pseudonocardiaceae bacterium]
MPPTLADLLAEPALRLRLHAGADQTDRRISWAHATELLDPSAFLDGGELLLTTGLALTGPRCAEYAATLARAGVAALGFGVGLTHRRVPAELVAAAAEHGLPLLEVPRPIPFIAITRAVAEALAAESYAGVLRTNTAQQELTRAAVGGVAALVRRLARLLDAWVLLTDGTAVPAASPATAAARLDALRADVDRLRGRRGVSTFARSLAGEEVVLQVLGDRPRAVLAVGRPAPLTDADRHILHTAAAVLTVALAQGAAQRSALRALRTGLFDLLAAGHHELVTHCLDLLGAPLPDEPVLVAALHGPAPARRAGYELLDTELGPAALLAERDGELLALLPADADPVAPAQRAGLRIGLSAPGPLAELDRAVRQAGQAVAAAHRGGHPVVRFGELAGEDLLGLLPRRAVAVAEALLAPLREADERGRGELVESLRGWLAAHGQWDPAATSLGVHRHTLRNRISRVESLLGRSLDSPGVRAELWFALQLVS